MKCPSCQTNHRPGKTRNLRCTCGYRFVFDPKRDGRVTDGKFLAIVRKVSMDDTAYFTENQLYAQFCQSQRKRSRPLLGVGVLLAAGAVCLLFVHVDLLPLSVMLGIVALICLGVAAYRAFAAPPDMAVFQTALNKWRQAGHSFDKLLTEPGLHTPPPEWDETDIYDYGVERILIVERDILVDLFVRNGLHAQERMLVLSESGYPDYLIPIAQRCLHDNPEVPVYLLHDAARGGPTMRRRLQVADVLPLEGHPLLDLGLFPDDVKRMPNLKVLQPHKRDFAVPVDVLLYATIGAGIAQAMAQNLAFSELLHPSGWVTSVGGVDGDFG